MFRLVFSETYEEKARRFLKKHNELKGQYEKCLRLLELDPFHPSLRLHKFKTSHFEGYSVSINLSYRISLEFLVSEQEIVLVNIGDHQDIYGKK
jgi:mRNA-degrading endonuclease YafQ of YafQ-DinJ toxin-antitoxin module